MTEPAPAAPKPPDDIIQVAVGLADTPLGQRIALTLTVLLGRDAAKNVAGAIGKLADSMSATGLVVPAASGNGLPKAAP